MESQLLPIGIDDFGILRRRGYYLIDKTEWIETFMNSSGAANLYTRPRRFAKTLNMTTLREFLDINGDPHLFDGLKIAENKEFCEKYQNKFPVIFLSLKPVDANDFDTAFDLLRKVIKRMIDSHSYLLSSERLDEADKKLLTSLKSNKMTTTEAIFSLLEVSTILFKHHDKNVIILIDEYDVPLDNAFNHNYYDEMIAIIRGMLGNALKTNSYLYTSALTGALRISKESIFTGLNNLGVDSITDTRFSEYFGFTAADVKKLLSDCGLDEHYDDIVEWYDGYRFGDTEVYNPWSVLNYCKDLLSSPKAKPKKYWANTSGNDYLRHYIDKSDDATKAEIESLIDGKILTKRIDENIIYKELYDSIENFWSVLFLTGYLTVDSIDEDFYNLKIPNKEVRQVYTDIILKWFKDKVRENSELVRTICQSLLVGDAETIEKRLNAFLKRSISINDNRVLYDKKENFYQGMMLSLLNLGTNWLVQSNPESGDGYPDFLVETDDLTNGCVIELKYAKDEASLAKSCEEAMAQIHERRYVEKLEYDYIEQGYACALAFYKKRCKVVMEKLVM